MNDRKKLPSDAHRVLLPVVKHDPNDPLCICQACLDAVSAGLQSPEGRALPPAPAPASEGPKVTRYDAELWLNSHFVSQDPSDEPKQLRCPVQLRLVMDSDEAIELARQLLNASTEDDDDFCEVTIDGFLEVTKAGQEINAPPSDEPQATLAPLPLQQIEPGLFVGTYGEGHQPGAEVDRLMFHPEMPEGSFLTEATIGGRPVWSSGLPLAAFTLSPTSFGVRFHGKIEPGERVLLRFSSARPDVLMSVIVRIPPGDPSSVVE